MPLRLALWLMGPLCAMALAMSAHAAVDAVPEAHDLSQGGPLAARADLPVLLIFTADDCTYCERLAEEVLVPMLRSGDYDQRVIMRAVNLTGKALIGFGGERVEPWTFASRYGVTITPTMIVVDHRGTPLAEPMVGLGPVEYVEARIAAALDSARDGQALHGAAHVPLPRGRQR